MNWSHGNIENCTQYYYEGRTCKVCGYEDGYWYAPDQNWHQYDDGHDWYQDGDGIWRCYYCNTTSNKGANGSISLETMGVENDELDIGWFNFRGADMSTLEIRFNVNYVNDENLGAEIKGDFWTNVLTTPENSKGDRDSGVVTIDVLQLVNAINELDVEVNNVWVFFWVQQDSVTGGEATMVGCGVSLLDFLDSYLYN
jgi:hypothetical protein